MERLRQAFFLGTLPRDPEIVAYKERDAPDPETGLPGTLRDEWRVLRVEDYPPGDLTRYFGQDWRNYRRYPTHVLEHRYVRRGVIEPWRPFDTAESFEKSLEYIDDHALPVHPKMIELVAARRAAADRAVVEREEKRRREAEQEERDYHKRRADRAFTSLTSGSAQGQALVERWDSFISDHNTESFRVRVQNDPRWMDLYRQATTAETVPGRRKAIREFLEYSERQE